ncbi:substrate-binding domain-containing protein [Tichowtungia aerotolerans]|uniref:Substrate-binding domain-containing protein n=1 Tax=Tichowtungia aerotolerans TaxID=2697043 RepID=A0A6P1MAP7_9BACT|nr:substrate-binding domain-containing protein [Tichowtungia aerotolerans]QHI68636.1 substrate-binding domain-containing protein [Tichowtungia aerotolerans]
MDLKQKKKTIGIILDIYSISHTRMITGIQEYIQEHNCSWDIRVIDTRRLSTPTPFPVDFDGIITPQEDPLFFNQKNSTVVFIRGDSTSVTTPQNAVQISHRTLITIAFKHLLSKGFKSIGLASCSHGPSRRWITRREEIFRQCCSQHDIAASIYAPRLCIEKDQMSLLKDIRQWLLSAPRPFAVIALNDARAMDILQCCSQNNIRIPEDVALMGIDNNPTICPFMTPSLTSISLNYRAIGYQAASLLDTHLCDSPPSPETIPFDAFTLIERKSTDISVPQDPLVQNALQFIREHCHSPIQMEDICTAVNSSHTTLNRRFQAAINSSLHEVLQRERLQRAKKMLTDPSMNLKEIAYSCGFQTPQYFSAVFRKHENTTPGQYRKIHQNPVGQQQPF